MAQGVAMLSEYTGVLMLLGLAIAVAAAALLLGRALAPPARIDVEPDLIDDGQSTTGGAAGSGGTGALSQSPVLQRFALLFVVFSAASVLFHPWGATLRETGLPGLFAIAVFTLPLGVVALYAWRKGAGEW